MRLIFSQNHVFCNVPFATRRERPGAQREGLDDLQHVAAVDPKCLAAERALVSGGALECHLARSVQDHAQCASDLRARRFDRSASAEAWLRRHARADSARPLEKYSLVISNDLLDCTC